MKTTHQLRSGRPAPGLRSTAVKFAAISLAAAALAGCKHLDDPVDPATFSLVDPSERHPIIVSQQPKDLTIKVSRGSKLPVEFADALDHAATEARARL